MPARKHTYNTKHVGAHPLGRRSNNAAAEHPFNLQKAVEQFERDYLQNVLVFTEWDIQTAAGMLGLDIQTLVEKIDTYQLIKQ